MSVDIAIILSSVLYWFYIDTVQIFENKQIINSGLIHSIFSSIGTNIACIMYPSVIYDYSQLEDYVPPLITSIVLISFGYGFYDLYIGIRSKKLDNIFHGMVFVGSFYGASYYGVLGMTTINLITETSSIFLNLRPYRKQWIDILFALTFFVYRIILSPLFLSMYVLNPNNKGRLFCFICTILIVSLNVYWFSLILKKIVYKKIN